MRNPIIEELEKQIAELENRKKEYLKEEAAKAPWEKTLHRTQIELFLSEATALGSLENSKSRDLRRLIVSDSTTLRSIDPKDNQISLQRSKPDHSGDFRDRYRLHKALPIAEIIEKCW